MESNNQDTTGKDASLLADVGENYYYVKTILKNRVEILKLEVFQNISSVVSFLILSLMLFFVLLIIITLLIVALVIYLAQIVGSYLTAILIISGVLIVISILGYLLFKPRLSILLENRMLKIFNEKSFNND